MSRLLRLVCTGFVALSLAAAAGCAGKRKKAESKMSWRPELKTYFDDQADLVRVRVKFKGKWNREFEEVYLGRVGYSDAIVVGSVKSLYYDTRWDKSRALIYEFEVSDLIKGGLGDRTTLALHVDESAVTEETASSREEIVGKAFFLYLKWVSLEEGTYHWHLSPYATDAAEEVKALIRSAEKGAKKGGGVKVIDDTGEAPPPEEPAAP